jgi:hypothetical protein
LAGDADHFPATIGPAEIHPGGAEENKNTASRSLFPSREQELSGARMSGSACACGAKKLRVRDEQRCHRIVRLSPCFCAHWPLCRPKDATKLNKSLHCTVDGADRSLAISRENKKETARFAGERPERSSRIASKDSNYTYGRWIVQPGLGRGRLSILRVAMCSQKEMTSARLISASRYLGDREFG